MFIPIRIENPRKAVTSSCVIFRHDAYFSDPITSSAYLHIYVFTYHIIMYLLLYLCNFTYIQAFTITAFAIKLVCHICCFRKQSYSISLR